MNVRRSRPAAAASNRRRVRAPRSIEAPPNPSIVLLPRPAPSRGTRGPSFRPRAGPCPPLASCRFPDSQFQFQFKRCAAPACVNLRTCVAACMRCERDEKTTRHGRACPGGPVFPCAPTSFPAGFASTRSGGRKHTHTHELPRRELNGSRT